jgi:hypothetical protein
MPTNTSLHIAIQNGNIEIIKMLLADGCPSLHIRNAEGQTPLDLAAAMNNEEVVRLLLEHGAGQPPQSPTIDYNFAPLDVVQRKKRITFWLVFICAALAALVCLNVVFCLVLVIIFSESHHPSLHQAANVVFLCYVFFVRCPLLIAYFVSYFFLLFRLWEEVPRQFARTTPRLAAGLSLIPFFGWYWMFVALGGLYKDMNKAMTNYGHSKRFNTTLISSACIVWLVCYLLATMFMTIFHVASAVDLAPSFQFMTLANLIYNIKLFLLGIFTIFIYWLIRKDVFEFMDIKASLEA